MTASQHQDQLVPDGKELLISADSHVDEPPDLWAKNMPSHLVDKVPPLPDRSKDLPGATDPADRLGVMARDGVSMEVLFPSITDKQFSYTEVELQQACFRVYNDWLIDYCSHLPDRLVGIPCISTYDIDHAIDELKRCTAAGTKGALLWHVPPKGLEWSTDHYDPLFGVAQEMDEPIVLHIASGFSYKLEPATSVDTTGVEYYRGPVNHKLRDVVNGLFDFIYYGVFERFPNLKLLLAEFEVGWVPWVLQQWDTYAKVEGEKKPLPFTKMPSEYFDRNVSLTFMNDEFGTQQFKSGWGINKCMWSSDFPHVGCTWPNSHDYIARDLSGIDAKSRARLLGDNVAELFRLKVPAPITQAHIN